MSHQHFQVQSYFHHLARFPACRIAFVFFFYESFFEEEVPNLPRDRAASSSPMDLAGTYTAQHRAEGSESSHDRRSCRYKSIRPYVSRCLLMIHHGCALTGGIWQPGNTSLSFPERRHYVSPWNSFHSTTRHGTGSWLHSTVRFPDLIQSGRTLITNIERLSPSHGTTTRCAC